MSKVKKCHGTCHWFYKTAGKVGGCYCPLPACLEGCIGFIPRLAVYADKGQFCDTWKEKEKR